MLEQRGSHAAGGPWSLEAPAKVNLFLEVLGKRDDGFHALETVMAPLRLADRLTFLAKPAGHGVRLSITGPLANVAGRAAIPTDDRNLVVRALHALQKHTGEQHGAEILLEKRVPAEAGLGGGSSDAAAALRLANHAWRLGCDDETLHAVAAEIGSDVPFFLNSSPAVCRGRGELIEPFAAPAGQPCVVVQPSFGLSTAAVYGEVSRCGGNNCTQSSDSIVKAMTRGDWRGVAAKQFNRLQESACRVAESLRSVAECLRRACALPWMMTGSGSAFFALVPSSRAARRLAAGLRQTGIGWAAATRLG